jgi:hypothetical protein
MLDRSFRAKWGPSDPGECNRLVDFSGTQKLYVKWSTDVCFSGGVGTEFSPILKGFKSP